ncbi:MAG: SYNERG-CTERM sorting domain-containing protein [Deltaproteobacteria bacterium]|nr:SYNERG-CTERM sorting domain-containing protein [Deltaproteobacteria bacterium]
MIRRSLVVALAMAGVALAPRVARADSPPYQPYEDACATTADGGACIVDLSDGAGAFQDGGVGLCGGNGTCAEHGTATQTDAGWECCTDRGDTCSPILGPGNCSVSVDCEQCLVASGPPTQDSPDAGSGSSSGCSTATAAAPWLLALLVPALVRRRKSA